MKKKLLILTILLTAFTASPVFAAGDCSAFKEITTPIYQIIMIGAPILLFVLSAIDILKAVTASDEKEMKKAFSVLLKRALICVVILILPLLINFVIGFTVFDNLNACIDM